MLSVLLLGELESSEHGSEEPPEAEPAAAGRGLLRCAAAVLGEPRGTRTAAEASAADLDRWGSSRCTTRRATEGGFVADGGKGIPERPFDGKDPRNPSSDDHLNEPGFI